MRYFLEIAFDGTNYHGWQVQANAFTVQEEINGVLSKIFRKETVCLGCGRTDTGVHARQFFLNFDTDEPIDDIDLFMRRFNGMTSHEIAAYNIYEVSDKVNARFDATSRTYEYRISLKKDPFEQKKAYFIWNKPDIQRMEKACSYLIGKKDFKAFSRTNDLKHHTCDLTEAYFTENGHIITFTITANRFLRNMVRAIMGTLIDIGQGSREPDCILDILESKDRSQAGQSVPADGLYLTKVVYPDEIFNKVNEPK